MELSGLAQGIQPRVGFEDKWLWVPSASGKFSVSSLWDVLRPRVSLSRLIWFRGNIPRHSFCRGWW